MTATLTAVDYGINPLRLLISWVEVVDKILEITKLYRLMEIIRLGQGVDATGMLAPGALERVREAPTRYMELMQAKKVQAVRMVATSATRDTSNRDDFFTMTRETLASWGAEAEVITGGEEATLSFRGAANDLKLELSPCCVVDVNSDSTEVIVGDHDGTAAGSDSVTMGNVHLTGRSLQSSPSTAEQAQKACSYVAELTDEIVRQVPVNKTRTTVDHTGTPTTLSALAQGLGTYDPEAIRPSQLCFTASCALIAFVAETDAESLIANPVIHPERTDVFAGGSIIVDGLTDMFEVLPLSKTARKRQRFFYISEKNIFDGIVTSLIDTYIVH